MPDYSQKHPKITTLPLLTAQSDLLDGLIRASRWKRPMVVIPSLATEYNVPETRPIFENIVRELKRAEYLHRMIIGLDRATEADVALAREILLENGVENYFLQWNDGPGFSNLYDLLMKNGFDLSTMGKGRNVFMSFGVALAMEASSVALLDADIRNFKRNQLDRIFFPVLVLNYQFSKAFYARWTHVGMYGRVKRLLVDPLLLALKRRFTDSNEEKMLRLIDFLLLFNYQLSGEIVISQELMQRMRVALNWGMEIFTLIEVYRKANQNQVAQVDFSHTAFEHKHQKISGKSAGGLQKMAIDIIDTLLNALIIEEGLEVSDYFFRDLAITYESIAKDLIKKYSDTARFNNIPYNRDEEEEMVTGPLKEGILNAAEHFLEPRNLADQFLRFTAFHPEFKKFNEQGLQQSILEVAERIRKLPSVHVETPSWERVLEKCPDIILRIIDVIEQEKTRWGPKGGTN
jgi:glucosyl-3-phosphoglycerate synthase